MSMYLRDSEFDVAIVASPRVSLWPSVGVRAISGLCAEMGLKVGTFGGPGLYPRGVVPLSGTGGMVLISDQQNRIHRVRARSIVKVIAQSAFPDPFEGWRSEGMIPVDTAWKLVKDARTSWRPGVAILGTGNSALRLGSHLLEQEMTEEVFCIESFFDWGGKRFSAWEVEKRRFEMLGGKIIEAKPVQLKRQSALLWDFKLDDFKGKRILTVARVVSAGPYMNLPTVREYPPGSLLFELEQTSLLDYADNVEGWNTEDKSARWLASKIGKSLLTDHWRKKEEPYLSLKKSKQKMETLNDHLSAPHTPNYDGKWLAPLDLGALQTFPGVPHEMYKKKPIASLECFESISCNLCQQVCPESAIKIERDVAGTRDFLDESKCTGCGICVSVCPSSAISLVHERENQTFSTVVLPWRGKKTWEKGELGSLVNRKGERLASARMLKQYRPEGLEKLTSVSGTTVDFSDLLEVETPIHLLWHARGMKEKKPREIQDESFLMSALFANNQEVAEVTLDGEKRILRENIPVSIALFETGLSRAGDALLCNDGSCQLCEISVDGAKKLGCEARVHQGMVIKLSARESEKEASEGYLCPCLNIRWSEVLDRIQQGKLKSPEAIVSVTHVGEGECHGQLCLGAFRRLLLKEGVDLKNWIDWRFPFSEWKIKS